MGGIRSTALLLTLLVVAVFHGTISGQPPSCTINWDGTGDGASWHDPFNWDTDALPAPSDDVCISVDPQDITVTHSSSVTTIITSLHSDEALVLSGGTLTIEAASEINSDFAQSGGTLTGPSDLIVFVILNVEEDSLTANLRAPVIVNAKNRKALQLLLEDSDSPLRHPVTA